MASVQGRYHVFDAVTTSLDEFRALVKASQAERSKRYLVDKVPGPTKASMSFFEELCVVLFLGLTIPGCVISIPLLLMVIGLAVGNLTLTFVVGLVLVSSLTLVPAPFREKALTSWISYQCLRYFSFKLLWEEEFANNRAAIKVAPPHGVFPYGNLLTMAAYPSIFGFSFKGLAASAAVTIPIFKHVLRTMGAVDASSKSATSVLARNETLGISTGGVAEVFETNASDDREVILLKARTGLIKLAFRNGAELIPCYLYGNSKLFSLWTGGPLHSTMKEISRKIGFALILFWGRFFLPIPFREPVFGVMGRAIKVEKKDNPTNAEVAALQARLCDEMVALFDRHKATYGWGHKKLVIE